MTLRVCLVSAGTAAAALTGTGCSLLNPPTTPVPPPPAIISPSGPRVAELQREVSERDDRIATLKSQIETYRTEIQQLKVEHESEAAPPKATPDTSGSDNSSPVSAADIGAAGSGDSATGGAAAASGGSTDTEDPTTITVWVDTVSEIFYYPGSRWYGKGKGQYMTEDQAIDDGYKKSPHR